MKILQVNKFNYLRGGAERAFLAISEQLEKDGHEVARFCMQHPKNLPSPWSKYFVSRLSFNEGGLKDKLKAPFRIIYSTEARRLFAKLLDDFKPDIIHCHNIYHQLSPSILPEARKRKIPVVMHLWDYKLVCPNYKLFTHNEPCTRCLGGKYGNCLKYRCFNSFSKSLVATLEMFIHHKLLNIYKANIDRYIAPCQFMKNICTQAKFPENKIDLVYNFYTPEFDREAPQEQCEDYLLYFGRLAKEKGVETLIRAAKIGKETIKIVGDGPELANLETIVKELKIEDKVKFLGWKHGEDLTNIINHAKAVIIPSVWYENNPFVLSESLIKGKIVIGSAIGGISEIIKDGDNGFIFKPGSPVDLASVIAKLSLTDLNLMSKRARASAQPYAFLKQYENLLKIYNSLISK
jgi:glycosyltransferase involved in cell wall biosynthesis